MVAQAFRDVEARHQLLEGFVRRLARGRDVDAYALRGGMLVRHWFPAVGRPVGDIDLVCSLPYDVADLRQRLAAVLATPADDELMFDADRFRIDRLRPTSAHPGMRLFAAGRAQGWSGEITVDLTFHLDVWPAATVSELVTERGNARLWTCQPEMLVGRKLQVTTELSRRHWRPKDLADLWLITRRFHPSAQALGEAVERSFADQPSDQIERFADVFEARGWWHDDVTRGRWQRHVRRARLSVPLDLDQVVADLRASLAPISRTP